MSIRLRVKLGFMELDYEGSEEFIKAELPNIVETLSALNAVAAASHNGALDTDDETEGNLGESTEVKPIQQMTTRTIASKLGSKSNADLIIAACARITLVQNQETFSRDNILQEMKSASGYYKESYSGNLSQALKSLVSNNKLVETSQDHYALSASQRKRLESTLAQ